MVTVHLLTWNLSNREAALNAFAIHLATWSLRGDHFVAAVQECADDAQAILKKVKSHGAASVNAVGNGTMSVLCSEPLAAPGIPNDTVGMRLVLTRASFDGRRIAIVNYHGVAQGQVGSPDPTERGGIASEARWRIDDHAAGDPVIVLGDFNAEPNDSEIESQHCLSLSPNPDPRSGRSHNRARSIVRVAPLNAPMGGTYLHTSGTRGRGWRKLDFVATGPDLAQTQALTVLGGVQLTNGTEPTISDHLPVAGTLDLP